MPVKKDLIGKKQGKLTFIKPTEKRQGGNIIWLCKCDCGNYTEIPTGSKTISCNCLNLKHGHRLISGSSPTYVTWRAMMYRVKDVNKYSYGKEICERWMMFENFLADMGERPNKNYHLHRMDNFKGYEPDNCEWKEKSQHLSDHKKGII